MQTQAFLFSEDCYEFSFVTVSVGKRNKLYRKIMMHVLHG